jgi:hypothetical protein
MSEQPLVVEITDRQSAEGQLETAIVLWFLEKDISSIHTLAVAAQGVLNQMCKEKRIGPSQIVEIINKDPSKKELREPQNFLKHGTDRNSKHKGFLVDCISMYARLFDTPTPLMNLFALRYFLFNPKAFPMQIASKGIKIEDLRKFSRPDFLEKVLPRLRVQIGKISPPN